MTHVVSISDARTNLPSLVDQVDEGIDEVYITAHKKIRAVLVNPDYLESLKETNEILAIPGALESIKRGEEQIKRGEFVELKDLID